MPKLTQPLTLPLTSRVARALNAALSTGAVPPPLPDGYAFCVDSAGNYMVDTNGNYEVEPV